MLKGFDYEKDKTPAIEGAAELAEWFGFWPSFHDAEILNLVLNRKGSSVLRLHTWTSTGALDSKGYFDQVKDVVVSFEMREIHDVGLADFSHQNVIFGLSFEPVVVDRVPEPLIKLVLGPCYGLSGYVVCKELRIQFSPGKPLPDE